MNIKKQNKIINLKKVLFATISILLISNVEVTAGRDEFFSTEDEIEEKLRKSPAFGKHIVFIEPYGATLPMLRRGLEKGHRITVLTADKDLCYVPDYILSAVSCTIKVDTLNEDAVENALKYINSAVELNAIIPGFEYFVPISSLMAEKYNLPTIGAENSLNVRYKDKMRLEMTKNGVQTPKYSVVSNIEELSEALIHVGLPAVCKPVDAAGSVNVKRVDSQEQAMIATKRILENNDVLWGHKLSQKMLVEEFIDAKEFSIEGIVQNGVPIFSSITEKLLSDEYDFIEVGHISNPPLNPIMVNNIENYVTRTIQSVKLNNAPFHAEIRYTEDRGPLLMEIAGRLAGDRIAEIMERSTGNNYYDILYNTYLGEKILNEDILRKVNKISGIRFFYRPWISNIEKIEGLEEVKALPNVEEVVMYYKSETEIAPFPAPLRRMGHAIVTHEDYEVVKNTLENANFLMKIHPLSKI